MGLPMYLGSIHSVLSEIHLDLGNLEKAMAHAKNAVELSRKNNERHWEAESIICLGRVISATDRMKFHEARGEMLKGMRILEKLQVMPRYAVGLLRLGELYTNTDRKKTAIENLKKAEGMFKEMGMEYWLNRTRKLLESVPT